MLIQGLKMGQFMFLPNVEMVNEAKVVVNKAKILEIKFPSTNKSDYSHFIFTSGFDTQLHVMY